MRMHVCRYPARFFYYLLKIMQQSKDLAQILSQHRRWLESGEARGTRADLSGARLDGANFSGVDLSGAIMVGTSLKRAVFTDAQLVHTNLSDACLQDAVLTGANLLLADFTRADLKRADLTRTALASGQSLGRVTHGPRFRDADLQGAKLIDSYCYCSDFSGANLVEADFSGAVLEAANLSNLKLAGNNFSDANLFKANLRNSDLTGAKLVLAKLTHADLQDSTLSNANVSGADLQSANFADCKVDGMLYDRKTRFKGIRVSSCFGSARFRRYAQDQDFIEEFREAHPVYYYLWLVLTDCGRSMLRVVSWSVAMAILFSVIYLLIGEQAFSVEHKETLEWNLFTTFYYSVVTFTTLGFGDITPRTPVAAGAVMLEVVTGYLMLGILISILASKVARRS